MGSWGGLLVTKWTFFFQVVKSGSSGVGTHIVVVEQQALDAINAIREK